MKINKCPVCGNTKTKKELIANNSHGNIVYDKKEIFTYFRCSDCDALFLTGLAFNSKFYDNYYSHKYRSENTKFKIENIIVLYSDYIKRKLIEKHTLKRKIKLLDIGSGHGKFIGSLNDDKYDATGLEIDADLVSSYKKKNRKGIVGDFLKMSLAKQTFDCVTMWHVIEHIPKTSLLINKINRVLKKGGLLVFSTPSTNSLGFKMGKEHWFHLDAPRHVVLFSNDSLNNLAEKNGFEVLETSNNWHDFPMDLFWSLRNTKGKLRYLMFYPYYKYKDTETITHIWRKN